MTLNEKREYLKTLPKEMLIAGLISVDYALSGVGFTVNIIELLKSNLEKEEVKTERSVG